jgi:hypothetical protein
MLLIRTLIRVKTILGLERAMAGKLVIFLAETVRVLTCLCLVWALCSLKAAVFLYPTAGEDPHNLLQLRDCLSERYVH